MNKMISGRYELLERIGIGGFAEIYRGWDDLRDQEVALKVLFSDTEMGDRFKKMFLDESELAAKLDHPNIVHFYDYGQLEDGRYYAVTEYVDGYNLASVIRKTRQSEKPLSHIYSVYILEKVAAALSYAHNLKEKRTNKPLNIVHRDVTPSNILISKIGDIKLTDFGIAKADVNRREKTEVLELKGKLIYMSPEQAKGGSVKVDYRSDIFSLGIVAFELLTGRLPYDTINELELYPQVLQAKVDFDSLRSHVADEELEEIVKRALQKEPDLRYQDASELEKILNDYLVAHATPDVRKDFVANLDNIFQSSKVMLGDDTIQLKDVTAEDEIEDYLSGEMLRNDREKNEPATQVISGVADDSTRIMATKQPGEDEKTKIVAPAASASGEDEGEKTMIDVVFDVWRYQRRKILMYGSIFIGFLLVLLVADIFVTQISKPAKAIYGMMHRPDLTIETIPEGALVIIDGKFKAETPVDVYNVDANKTHDIIVRKDGFEELRKSITPMEAKEHRVQKISLAARVKLSSFPEGANIYINGVEIAEKTPCLFEMTAGEDNAIKYYLSGYDTLKGCTVNIESNPKQQVDRFNQLFWNFSRDTVSLDYTMELHGTLYRTLPIKTLPKDAKVYVDNELRGTAALLGNVVLHAGKRKIVLRRKNWMDLDKEIDVNAETAPLEFVMSRFVRFAITGEDTTGTLDDATVYIPKTKYASGVKASERVILSGRKHIAFAEYPGFQRKKFVIGATTFRGQVRLEKSPPAIRVLVFDKTTNEPLANAEVFFTQNGNYVGYSQTDSNGEYTQSGSLEPGAVLIRVNYLKRNFSKNIKVEKGKIKTVKVYL